MLEVTRLQGFICHHSCLWKNMLMSADVLSTTGTCGHVQLEINAVQMFQASPTQITKVCPLNKKYPTIRYLPKTIITVPDMATLNAL